MLHDDGFIIISFFLFAYLGGGLYTWLWVVIYSYFPDYRKLHVVLFIIGSVLFTFVSILYWVKIHAGHERWWLEKSQQKIN